MGSKFYDLQYEAWRSGRNPDHIDYDRYSNYRAQGYYPDEISLNMMLPRKQQEEWPKEDYPCE